MPESETSTGDFARAARSVLPHSPVLLDQAFEDPTAVLEMVPRHAPYWPVMRYAAGAEELKAMVGDVRYSVEPWFRGDWAGDAPSVEGVDRILWNPVFLDGARRLFDAEIVVPRTVYVNLMAPMAYQATAHSDIPVFRGIDKPAYPVWLLHVMHRSGLFAAWRVEIATAVSWFYEGEGGEFEFWPQGPSAAPRRIDAPLSNRGIVGDNERMFHRIAAIGTPGAPLLTGATVDSELRPIGDGSGAWRVVSEGCELIRYEASELRISVSWKAEIFSDSEAARTRREGTDDLDLEAVVDIFMDALAAAGESYRRPSNPLRDEEFIALLNALYPMPSLVE
jgi:hypothetical protein